MRDFLAVVGLLALVTWGLCHTGYLTPAEVRTLVAAGLLALAALVEG